MVTKVTLNKFEQFTVEELVKKIGQQYIELGWQDRLMCDYTDEDKKQLKIDGHGAEMAFAKMFNCFPDLSVSPRQHGHDIILDGIKIAIKEPRYTKNPYLVAWRENPDVEIYVLMICKYPIYEYGGWIDANTLHANKSIVPKFAHNQAIPNMKMSELYKTHPSY